MSGIVGSFRAPGVDLARLARQLIHTPEQAVLARVVRDEFDAAQVGLSQQVESIHAAADAEPCVLVSGEILELGGAPVPHGASAVAAAYARDPSCDFLAQSSGVFSGVIFDPARRRIVLFTDTLGLGHLYYAVQAGTLLFASEQKCFYTAAREEREILPRAVEEFLQHGHLVGDTTWFRDVQLLPSGACLIFESASGTSVIRTYRDLCRESPIRYASFAAVKEGVKTAYQEAFVRATRGVGSCRTPLAGGVASRMLLASAEAAGLPIKALTVAGEDSEDALYAQRACAVHNTVQQTARPHPAHWLLSRARYGFLGDGVDLTQLGLSPLAGALAGGHTLSPLLGELALGTLALRGFDDLRAVRLLQFARRRFGAVAHTWAQFAPQRFPFADPQFWSAALGAEVPYLLHGRLRFSLAQELFPDYFSTIPIAGSGGRTAPQMLAGVPAARPSISLLAAVDPYAYLRADAKAEGFLWELLSDPASLYGRYVDVKQGHAVFWAFFRGSAEVAPAAVLRFAALEIWLRQLLRSEHLDVDLLSTAKPRSPAVAPDISVIVPAYNVEQYVGECLNSLCNQDLTKLEILVVDDGSTDGTHAVLERFAREDPRIRIIQTPNLGVYHARNRALEEAKGRYISFVDADDYAHPSMLRLLLRAAEARRAEVAFCDVYQFDPEGAPRVRRNTLGFKAGIPLSLATAPEMISDGFSTLWNRIYDRSFLQRHKLKFDERFRISADMLFLQELLAKATTIVRVPHALYYYRFATPNSLTSYEVRNAKYLVHLQITIELIDFWVRAKLFERYAPFVLLRALRNFLWNTHIDASRLSEVFGKLHEYLKTLRVGPVASAKLPPFERRIFQLLRAGDFPAFMRSIRRYRAKMIRAKGGELDRVDHLVLKYDSVKSQLKSRLSLRVDKAAGEGRFRVVWPAAQLGLMLDQGAPLAENNAQSSADSSGTAGAEGSTEGAPDTTGLRRAYQGLKELRDRMFFEADLDLALSKAKPGAAHRVLHFSNAFSVPSETFTYDVITGLEQSAVLDNYVMCFDRQLVRERPYGKTIELHGGTRADLEAFKPRAMHKIHRVIERLSPDLVHCHFGWVGVPLVMWLAQRGNTTPVVITMHGTDVNMWPARHVWYADALKSMVDKRWVFFTTHTETYREKLRRLGVPSAQIDVIPNSFDPKFGKERGRRHGFELGDHLRVISVARMDIWKGHEHLIRGFERFVRMHYSNASLTLIGYGPEEGKLRALVAELGIQEKVRFYGRAAHHEVPVLLRNHDVYVQPSIKHPETLQEEGQPIAVLEAIASGMPVIVTDTGAMAETVGGGAAEGQAWIVPDKDHEAIALALLQVVEVAGQAVGRDEYVRAISAKHAREGQLERTLRLYERAWRASAAPGGPVGAVITPIRER